MYKRITLRIKSDKNTCRLQQVTMSHSAIWFEVATLGKDHGRQVYLMQSNTEQVNLALSILEQLPQSSLKEHSGCADRLERLLKQLRQNV